MNLGGDTGHPMTLVRLWLSTLVAPVHACQGHVDLPASQGSQLLTLSEFFIFGQSAEGAHDCHLICPLSPQFLVRLRSFHVFCVCFGEFPIHTLAHFSVGVKSVFHTDL